MNNRGEMGWVGFVAIMLVVIVAVSLIIYFARDKFEPKDNQPTVQATVQENYPLRIKSLADYKISYRLFTQNNVYIEDGYLLNGVTESYLGAKYNQTYVVRVRGEHHYYLETTCKQLSEDSICVLNPKKIATPTITYEDQSVVIRVGEGEVIQNALLCASWTYPTLSVLFNDLERNVIPDRLLHVVDKCFYVGNIVDGVLRLPVEVRKDERVETTVKLVLVDKDVDEDYDYTYEVDSGLKDLHFNLTS